VATLSSQLVKKYGQAFDIHNIRKMICFAEKFNNLRIVTPLATQLSWSHFFELLLLETEKQDYFWALTITI